MELQCEDCHRTFASRQTLEYHLNHHVCQKNKFVCSTCQKQFTTMRGLNYHTNNCVCEKKISLKLKDHNKYVHLTKDELLTKVAKLEGKVEALTENPKNVDYINNKVINNIIVFPKELGKEDMKHVQQKLGDVVGPLIKNHTFTSIPTLFNTIHNNQQLPEYHNVYSNSERSSYVLISDGKTFKYRPKKTIIDQIIEEKRSILNQYVDDNGDQLGEKILQKYDRYQERLDDDNEFRKNLEMEIGGLLLDMKSVIANDEKTRHMLDRVNEGKFELTDETPRSNN